MLEFDALTAILFCSSHRNQQTMVYTSGLKSQTTQNTLTSTPAVYKQPYRQQKADNTSASIIDAV
jgi:hypothetical protein